MSKRRILVVDDDPGQREISREYLESAGYCVSEAATGKLAVDALTKNSFDAVMTDLRMPAASGEALIQWILVNQPAMKSRILIATGDVMSPGLGAFTRNIGLTVLAKPYHCAQLLDAIRPIIETETEIAS
jgi:DNA-binding NtrC family response regulator